MRNAQGHYLAMIPANSWWGCDAATAARPLVPWGYGAGKPNRHTPKLHLVSWLVYGWHRGMARWVVAGWRCGGRSNHARLVDDRTMPDGLVLCHRCVDATGAAALQGAR